MTWHDPEAWREVTQQHLTVFSLHACAGHVVLVGSAQGSEGRLNTTSLSRHSRRKAAGVLNVVGEAPPNSKTQQLQDQLHCDRGNDVGPHSCLALVLCRCCILGHVRVPCRASRMKGYRHDSMGTELESSLPEDGRS